MRNLLKRWTRAFARDEGVAGIVIAIVVSILAFSALAVFMAKHLGISREIVREQSGEKGQSISRDALFAYFKQHTDLPCPDTDLNGTANTPCNGSGVVTGTLPWQTLAISRDDAIDEYGRYYTYVVLADQEERQVCESVVNGYNSSDVDYPGTSIDQTSLEVRETGQAAGQGSYVRFAVISHGKNGLGGTTSTGTAMADPEAGSFEEDNVDITSVVYSGPYNATTGSTYFDDRVVTSGTTELENVCKTLAPGGQINATLGDDFADAGPGFDAGQWTTDGGANAPEQSGGQAVFDASGTYLATLTSWNFAPLTRPVYVSGYWTPDSGNATSGFSIVTRATPSTQTSDDLFTTGVTFRFFSTGTAGNNTVTIRESTGGAHATSGNYNLIQGQQYFIEAYDDGSAAWARISQVSNPSNAAEAIDTSLNVDLTGEQRVLFVGGSGTNRFDNVIIGTPMLSVLTGPADGFVSSADGTNDVSANLSLEAWIRPRTVQASGTAQTIISQWDTADLANSGFRLFLDGSALKLGLRSDAGANEDVTLGITATVNTWMHVAVTYDSSSDTVTAYKDGVLASSTIITTATGPINEGNVEFVVGADTMTSNTAASNFFSGNISDVRVWNSVRSATNIAQCYEKRLGGANCGTTGLVVNWKLDPTVFDGGIASTAAANYGGIGAAGTLRDGAYYAPALAIYFRPNANAVCDAEVRISSYECAFRTPQLAVDHGVITPPTDLIAIFAKAWAGGGGGYSAGGAPADNDGGGGAFARGLIPNSGAWDIVVGSAGALGSGGVDGTAGTSTTITVGSTLMFDVPPGTGGGDQNNNDNGNGGNIANGDIDNAVLNEDIADGAVPDAGCIPSGNPCTDPHWAPSYASTETPGRGGTTGGFAGHSGAVTILW
ncbi:MAG: LamG domain-containing protein [Rhodospirillaceae bacterium]